MNHSRWGIVALLVLSPGSIRAEEQRSAPSDPDACLKDDLCRAQYSLARELSKTGNLKDSLAAYVAAYQRQSVPILLFNIARLHHRLGNYQQAVTHYRHYLQTNAASEAAQRSRAQEFLLEALQGLEDSKQHASDEPEPSSEPAKAKSSAFTQEHLTSSGQSAASSNSASTGTSTAPPSSVSGAMKSGPNVGITGAGGAQTSVDARWLTPQRKLQLGLGLGVTGALVAVAVGSGVGALRLDSAVRNAVYVGTGPPADIQNTQSTARSLAIVTDVAIAASAVSLAVTLAFTLRRARPSAVVSVASSGLRRN